MVSQLVAFAKMSVMNDEMKFAIVLLFRLGEELMTVRAQIQNGKYCGKIEISKYRLK